MPRTLTHTTVEQLPKGAITVSQYAKNIHCSTSLIYHRLHRGKADYSIVIYQNINFVVPN